jgi:P-type conjugative transfer protein TrbL
MKQGNSVIFRMVFAGMLFLALFLSPGACEADVTILEEIYNTVEEYRSEWLLKLGNFVWWSFAGLLSISFIWQASQMVLADSVSFGGMTGLVVRTGMYGGFFKWIFSNPDYVMLIPDTFIKLSELVTGYKVDVFNLLNIVGDMMSVLAKLEAGLSWYLQIVGALATIVVSVMLYGVVGIILMLKIEVTMVTLAGFSLLVFCGLNTLMADYAMTYVKALIGCGLKLFMCGIVGGMLQDFCRKFVTMANAGGGFLSLISTMLGILMVLWIIVSNIPNYVSSIFYGVPAGSAGAAWGSAVTFANIMKGGVHVAGKGGNVIENVVGGGLMGMYLLHQKLSGKNVESADNSVTFSNPSGGNEASRRDADGSF